MLRHISKLEFKFNPTRNTSRSIRQLMSMLMTDKSKLSNPKCIIDIVSNDSVEKPTLNVVFNDKKILFIETEKITAGELVGDIEKISRKLQMDEDIRTAV